MLGWNRGLLDVAQSEFVGRRLSEPQLVEDLSWGLSSSESI